MAWQIMVAVFYFLLLNYLIYRWRVFHIKYFKPVISNLLFNLKCLTGVLIWLIYTFYYKDLPNNDIHKFFNDAVILNQSAYTQPHDFVSLMCSGETASSTVAVTSSMKNWNRNFDEAPFNENRTIIRLNALLMFFSFRVYFVHILFMCLISLLGWVLIINSVYRYAQITSVFPGLCAMLLPSVLFWTSGVMKEPLLVLGLGLFIHSLLNANSFKHLLAGCSGFLIILMSKFFILAALIPAAVAYAFSKGDDKKGIILLKYAAVILFTLIFAFGIPYVIPRINPAQMLVNKQTHSVKEAAYFNAGSRIEIPPLNTDAASIITAAPGGVWNTLLRPYAWEAKNPMMMASSLENLLILVFIAFCILYTGYRDFRQLNLALLLLTFSLAYFALIGICTPVLGNLVRYRAPVLPFLLFACSLNIQKWDVTKSPLLLRGFR